MLAVYNQTLSDCTLKNKYYNRLTDELYVHFLGQTLEPLVLVT